MKKETIPYHENSLMDIYAPDSININPCPLLLWLHGGAGTPSDRSDAAPLAEKLAALGIALAAPDFAFPLAPDRAELRAAVSYCAGLGAKALFLGGHSSGAHAAGLVFFDPEMRDEAVKGGIFASPGIFTHALTLEARGEDARRVVCDRDAPLYHIFKGRKYPPVLITCGTKDSFPHRVEQSSLLAAAIRAADKRAKVELRLFEGEAHGSYLETLLPPAAADFMRENIG